jgi:hypothetical protein
VTDLLTISFTAARDLDEHGKGVILNVLCQIPVADRYVTGACVGGDAFIGRWLLENRPGAEHVVIVPGDRSRVDPWWQAAEGTAELIWMPRNGTYRDRNAELVRLATFVVGSPAYPEDDPRSARSGSWQTIRMARRAGKLCRWDCVKPPFRGCIEKYPSEFGATRRYTSDGN